MSQELADSVREAWAVLRACWREAASMHVELFVGPPPAPDLRSRHDGALDRLAAAGAVDAETASQVRAAFEQAVAHLQHQMALCYIAFPVEMAPRQDLLDQARALEEIAVAGALDADAGDRVRAALEQDIAWLAEFNAGHAPPPWRAMPATAVTSRAARLLSDLLTGAE